MAKFLGGLASRPWIFATDYFRDACEATARSNIAALLDEYARAGYLGKL
jgi:predicted metal-dependent HD superfamily phosphohydrolase